MPRLESRIGQVLIYRPRRITAVAAGLTLLVASLALALAALLTFEQRYPDPSAVLFAAIGVASGVCLIALTHLTLGVARLTYTIRDFTLWMTWSGARFRVPLGDVTAVVPGTEAGPLTGRSGLTWWGLAVGRAHAEKLGPVVLLAADPRPDRLLFVVTPSVTVGLSIDPASPFAEYLGRRRSVRRSQEWPRAEPAAWRAPAIWSDGLFQGVAVTGGLTTCLAWALALDRQAIFAAGHSFYLGSIRVDRGSDLIALVLIGAAFWAVDLVVAALLHPSEPVAARALVVAGWLVQMVIALALLQLVRG